MGTEDQKRQSEPPYKGEPKIAPDRGKLRPEDIPPTNGRPEPPSRPSEPPRGRYAMATEDVPAAPNPFEFYPDQIVLYGVKLNQDESPVALPFFDTTLNLQVRKKKGNKPVSPKKMVIAVVYGYAFEGHCYRFDKPKLLIFNRSFEGPAEGCGFGNGYTMWKISSKKYMVELSMSIDLAETLVLEANKPGNRAPNTYGNDMQLAHRGGRLSRMTGP